jgi:hypothetical protein
MQHALDDDIMFFFGDCGQYQRHVELTLETTARADGLYRFEV